MRTAAPAMLTVFQSNRLETLADALRDALLEDRGDPFAPETIVVPSGGVGRWLQFALAERLGIAANLRFAYAASLVWQLFGRVLADIPRDSPFEPEALAWRFFALLGRERSTEAFAPVRRYLAPAAVESRDDATGRRFELAQRIAQVFDRYLVHRADWLQAWAAGRTLGLGPDEAWQAALWREATEALEGGPRQHPSERFFAELERRPAAKDALPRRLHVFAVSALPPLYLDVFTRLADHRPVTLYALNPGGLAYWGDIRKRHAAAAHAEAQHVEVGNALLASWGRHAQALFDAIAGAYCVEAFADPGTSTLLAALQSDVLNLRDRGDPRPGEPPSDARPARGTIAPDDRSLALAVCHGATREVEAFHDWLLDAFERDPTLTPGDVLALVPDLEAYAPAIEAVFATAPEGRRIPFTIADRGLARESDTARTFVALLRLPLTRLDAESVLGLLDTPAVARRFGFAPSDVATVREWVRETGIRWGRDADARRAYGFPALADHTWRAGLERLLLGYALPADGPKLWGGILPYDDVEGTGAALLGALASFADEVFALDAELRRIHSSWGWRRLLDALLDRFFAPDDDEEGDLQLVREAIARVATEAARGGCDEAVPLTVLRRTLEGALAPVARTQSFLAGGVTFGALLPGRPIPVRVVALLGMNDGVFPSTAQPPSFDLMATRPRAGDRVPRDESRYALLETVLGARDHLYVSYTGRSARDNAALPPAVVVSELRDMIRRGFVREDGADPVAAITLTHALQPFSARYFLPSAEGDGRQLFSYSEQYATASRAAARAARSGNTPRRFVTGTLPATGERVTELAIETLIRGIQNPARRFLRDRLGVVLEEGESLIEATEPFALDPLAAAIVRRETFDALVAGAHPQAARDAARARGRLPHGAMGDAAFYACAGEVAPVADFVRSMLAAGTLPPVAIAIPLGALTLRATLSRVTGEGQVAWHTGKLNPKQWIGIWARHLAFNACDVGAGRPTLVCGLRQRIDLAPIEDARQQLAALLHLWVRAGQEPVPFFPWSSHAFADVTRKGRGDPLRVARAKFYSNESSDVPGECEDAHVELAFRGVDDPLAGDFGLIAIDVFAPLFEAMEVRT